MFLIVLGVGLGCGCCCCDELPSPPEEARRSIGFGADVGDVFGVDPSGAALF